MKSELRDVLLLGAATSAFMLLVFVSPVGAQEALEDAPAPTAQLAANDAATPAAYDEATTRRAASTKAEAYAADDVKVEQRCEYVRRINKFTIRRCD